ncbi:MAG: S8 family serine peptidase [Elusimicrobia bacterium]|nr:S8 family serine peptidase [Elusimicrobiota bacterium]
MNSAPRRLLSAALAAALTLSSFGPRATAAAQEIAAGASSVRVAAAPAVLVPASVPLSPSLSATSAAPALAPLAAPAASISASAAPSAVPAAVPAAPPSVAASAVSAAPAETAAPAAAAAVTPARVPAAFAAAAPRAGFEGDAANRLGALFDASRPAQNGEASPAPAAGDEAAPRLARAASVFGGARDLPPPAERQARSAYFPLALSAAVAAAAATFKGAGALAAALLPAAGALHFAPLILGAAAVGAFALSGVLALNALADAAVFAAAVRRGRGVTDEAFRDFVRGEVLAGRLDANAAALLKPYRPRGRFSDMTFAFAARGSIWVRPELAAYPGLFRLVLVHELRHWKSSPTRGPPRRGLRGLLSRAAEESYARAAELRGVGSLKSLKVPALERALRQAQVSLRRDAPYEILVLNPGSAELEDPKLYAGLSGGAAAVVARDGADPAAALGEAAGKGYRAVVLGGPAAILPAQHSRDAAKLEGALSQLDSLYVLATRLVARPQIFKPGSSEARAYSELAVKAQRLRLLGAPLQAMSSFETEVRRFWRQLAATRLKGVAAADIADRLYAGLRDRGSAFLSFGPEDRGEQTWERLLRYWESEDGGRFGVTRVDLEDGGHILILRKLEARVGLWLRPVNGGRIAVSVPRASDSEDGRAAARRALLDAGFADQLKVFAENGVSVRHVFGADVGRQEIYVTVPRRRAAAIRRFVVSRAEATIGRSEANFRTHLVESGDIQNVPPVWKAGITGKGGKILWIDTGADATHEDFAGRLDVIDMVDEGPEDWVGHGTHVAGISISGGAPFLGMAKGATGTMAKVFSRDGNGASDGEIMGSAAIAQQKGYDVISLSLGSRGSSSDNLSEFLSRLTRQKNAAGEYPIVSASAGNAGPFDRTLSQPAAGVDVLAVAAAAKSLDDGRPEISFYSSVGPDVDRRFAVKRFRLKPEITGVGGDVVTQPGTANLYKYGVYSAKSKDAPRSASDLEDGRHTGMSGTSMSNPAVAGIALLVKLAMKAVGAFTPFVADNLPFAVKAVLMRSARDLEAPLWFQGAGLVDAGAAVALVARAAAKNLSRRMRALAGPVSADPDAGWGWLERLKAVVDAEDRVFDQVPASAATAAVPSEGPADGEAGPEDEPAEDAAPEDRAAAEAARAAAAKRFMAARDREVPALVAALKDPVWLVRQRAAFTLMNLRASAAALALGEAALNDSDARVRQTALLALAEIPTHAADELLRAASSDPRWDVGVYAAYALARRGDRGGVGRIVMELGNADKRARFASAWLAGQLGAQATAAEAEALSARLKDTAERGNIRHLAAASLSNIADAAPAALSDRVVADILDAAGSGNVALTRTLSRVFPAALREREFVARLRREPLKSVVVNFVLANKSALRKPGALAELVLTLARAGAVPLDAPTALPDPSGAGVAGVDPALGPLDVFVAAPSGRGPSAYADASDPAALSEAFSSAGLDAGFLSRFESAPRAALPVSGGLWLSVPEHKLYALSLALQGRGLKSHLVRPETPLVAADAPAASGTTLDLTRDAAPTLPANADLSWVRVRASAPVSEARALAALEQVAARARGRGPTVVSLALSAPIGRGTALSMLVDRLVLSGVGVVVGAGDGGPASGTTAGPADAGPAVMVAAAGPDADLQFYSGRGTPQSPRLSWTDRVDPLKPGESADAARTVGTGAAAERSAGTLAELARVMAGAFSARGRALPDGWFLWLVSVVKAAAAPMPGYAPHEVGAGLLDAGRARAELVRRLGDLDSVASEADALVAAPVPGTRRK